MNLAPRASHGQPTYRLEAGEAPEEQGRTLLDYWELLVREWKAVVLVTIAGAVGGYIWCLPQTPLYQAKLFIEVQEQNPGFLNLRTVNPDAGFTTPGEYVETQARILQSRSVKARASERLLAMEGAPSKSTPSRFPALLQKLGLPKVGGEARGRKATIGEAGGSLKVKRVGDTHLLELMCESSDRQVAADYLNVLVKEYVEEGIASRVRATQQTTEWLNGQIRDLRGELHRLEGQFQQSARASAVAPGAESGALISADRLRQVQQELSTATARRIESEAKYKVAVSSKEESLPEVLDDSGVRGYLQKLTELRAQLIELSSTLTPEHYKVKRVQEQINDLQVTVARERSHIVNRLRNDLEAAMIRERMLATSYRELTREVSDDSAQLTHYNVLKREVDSTRQLYELMLQRLKESEIASALRSDRVRVIDRAEPPSQPYSPDFTRMIFTGFGVGLFAGVIGVAVRDRFDRRLRAPGEDRGYLNVPELGAIISAPQIADAGNKGTVLELEPSTGQGEAATEPGPLLNVVTWAQSPSPQAESFRAVLTSLLSYENQKRVLVFTSPSAGEGKTTVLGNLGAALAEIDRRVLMIDADLREPRLHKVFQVPNSWGLSDLVNDRHAIETRDFEAMVKQTSIPGLYILPSGPGIASIHKLLYSVRLDEILTRFRAEVDMILIDTPPMLEIPDARVLARKADGVVMVLRAGKTTRNMARAALQRFVEDGTPIVGTILNDWKPKTSLYKYYRGRYYGRAGGA